MTGNVIEGIRSFYDELRRRRVLRVAAVYAAVGWAIVEVSATTFPLLHLPDWTATLVLVLVLLGFPLATGLAWAFDLTPGGVSRTDSVASHEADPTAVAPDAAASMRPRASGTPPRRARRWVWTAVGLGVIVAGVAVGYRMTRTGPEGEPRVMVLPYENQTGDASLDPLGRMAAEWIANGLMEIPEIDVVPHPLLMEALEQARGRTTEGAGTVLDRVAEATGATIGVTGAFYRQQAALEFHTQVLDVASSEPLAIIDPVRGSADDPVQGIDSVQIQVMGALATRLGSRLAWELPPAAQPPTYHAYLAYGNGMEAWVAGDYGRAAGWFEEAFARDTTYLRALMLAWSARANAGDATGADSLEAVLRSRREDLPRYDRYRLDWTDARRRGDHRAALAAARSAMELNPTGTLRLGFGLSLRETNRPGEALQTFDGWIAESNTAATWFGIWTQYTRTLHILGDYGEELDVARRERDRLPAGQLPLGEAEARALVALGELDAFQDRLVELEAASPEGPIRGRLLYRLALELRAHGYRDTATELAERAIAGYDVLPDELRQSREGRTVRAGLAYAAERWSEAAELWAGLEQGAAGADLLEAVGGRGAAAARLGDQEAAEAAMRRLTTLPPGARSPPGVATLHRARTAALLGDRARAVELLRQAFASGQAFGIWLHRDMDLESLRGYAPYERLVEPEG